MTSPGQLLDGTRDERIKLFLSKLDSNFDKFTDLNLNGTLCRIPRKNQIPNKRYYQFKVHYPIGYETTTKYRIRVNGTIFDLYKFYCNYYMIDLPHGSQATKGLFKDFSMTVQFSFCFELMWTLLKEITNSGETVELHDYLYTGLLDKYNTENGRLKVYITPFSVKNKVMTPDNFYVSLFN